MGDRIAFSSVTRPRRPDTAQASCSCCVGVNKPILVHGISCCFIARSSSLKKLDQFIVKYTADLSSNVELATSAVVLKRGNPALDELGWYRTHRSTTMARNRLISVAPAWKESYASRTTRLISWRVISPSSRTSLSTPATCPNSLLHSR